MQVFGKNLTEADGYVVLTDFKIEGSIIKKNIRGDIVLELKDVMKVDDWKKEKHVPVISIDRDIVKKGEYLELKVSIGKSKRLEC